MTKIYGKNVVKEAINAKRKIEKVYFEQGFEGKDREFFQFVSSNVPFEVVSVKEFKQEFQGNSQGVGAVVQDYQYKELSDILDRKQKQYFIILDGLEDPHNLGAILRTADASRIDGIIIPKNRSVSLNSTVAKVSVGAIEYVNVIQVNNLSRTIEDLKTAGFWIIGTDMNGEKDYTEIDPSTSLAIVIGSEGTGISKLVRKNCDFSVKIPMHGKVNSLNASVTAGILMYEINRKRGC